MKFLSVLITSISFLFFSIIIFGQVKRVVAPGITVKDMNTSVKFYSEVVGSAPIPGDRRSFPGQFPA